MSVAISPPQTMFPSVNKTDPDSGKILSTPAYNTFVSGCQCVSRQYQSLSAPASIGGAVSIQDFIIQKDSDIHQYTDLMVAITVSISGATGLHADFLPSYYFLQTYQPMLDNAPRETYQPAEMFSQFLYNSTNMQLQTLLPLIGAPPVSGAFSPTVLTVGDAPRTFFIPLTLFTWVCNGVLMPQVTTDVRLRLNFNTFNTWLASSSTATAANLNVTNLQLYAQGMLYRPSTLIAVTEAWAKTTHIFTKVSPVFKQVFLGSAPAGVQTTKQTLNTVAGGYALAFVQVFDTNAATNQTYLTPLQADVQFLNADGSLYNFLNSDSLIRYQTTTQFPQSQIPAAGYQQRNYVVPFVLSANNSLLSRQGCAGWLMGGFESVQVTPATTLTNGRLDVHMYQNALYSVTPISGLANYTPITSQARNT